jgi:hypothetical protein
MISEDKLFQAFVSPTIFISATGLLILTLNTRLISIVSRIRTFNKELRDLTDNSQEIILIESQLNQTTLRAKLIRFSLLFILMGIIGIMMTCLFLGLNLYVNMYYESISFFVISILFVICGLCCFMAELIICLQPIQEERIMRRVISQIGLEL